MQKIVETLNGKIYFKKSSLGGLGIELNLPKE